MDGLASKNRPFVMKQPTVETQPKSETLPEGVHQEPKQAPKKTTDKEGLDQAYASDNGLFRDAEGTLRVAGTRRGSWGQTGWRTTECMVLG